MNLVLIGYRGTGKSTLAQRLALRLGWPWIDADVELELRAGMSIAAIFERQGEEAFRDLESSVVADLCRRDETVLALGGGAVLREQNRACLVGGGNKIVWLTATPRTLHRRVSGDDATALRRPNLTGRGGLAEIEQLLTQREPLYRRLADVIVDTEDKSPGELTEEILERLDFKFPGPA